MDSKISNKSLEKKSSEDLSISLLQDALSVEWHYHYGQEHELSQHDLSKILIDIVNKAMVLWVRQNNSQNALPPSPDSTFSIKNGEEIQEAIARHCRTSKTQLEDFNKKESLKKLAEKYGMDIYEFDFEIPNFIISKLPKDLAVRYNVIPVDYQDGVLVVAMSEPGDLELLDSIRYILRTDVEGMIADPQQVAKAVEKYYGMK